MTAEESAAYLPDQADVQAALDDVIWHEHYAWSPFVKPAPEGIENPCGGCGRAESEHPVANVSRLSHGRHAATVAALLRAALNAPTEEAPDV